MKKLLFLLVICLSSTAFSQVPNYVPSNGLIGYWPFNGNANDESGNGNEGTVNGATLTADRFGNANAAYDFDGIDDCIDISSSSIDLYNYDVMTISCWVNVFGVGSSGNGGAIIGKYTQGSPNSSSFALQYLNTSVQAIGNGIDDWNSQNNVITYGSWNHIIVEYDRINSDVLIYVDSSLITQGSLTYNNANLSNVLVTIGRLYAGAIGDVNSNHFNGLIDDIGIWNRALTQQEITDLYNTTTSSACIEVSPSADTLCAGESTTLTASFSDSRWQNYYFEDFELGASSEWSSSSTFSYEGSQLLGRYGNNNIALNLSNLPAHDSVRVEFDLFIGDTWDGYSLLGGSRDIWRLRLNGDTIINATFAACCGSAGVGNGGQSYPDNIPAVNPATTGAFALDLPDFVGSGDGTDLYKVSRSSADTSSSLTIEFSAQDLQNLSDESWALDNVRVYLYSSDVVNDVLWSTGDTTLSITVSPSTTTTYYATLDDGLSLCLDSAVVEVDSIPFDLGADTISLCDTATTLDAGPGYGSYLWSTGETSQTIDVDSSGMYSVVVSDSTAFLNRSSLSFDGINDYVSLPANATNLDLVNQNNLTLSAWIYHVPTSSQQGIITSMSDIVGPQNLMGHAQYALKLSNSRIYFLSGHTNYGFEPSGPTVGNTTLSANQWYHVSVTYDGTTLKFYLDGNLDFSQNIPNQVFPSSDAIFEIGRYGPMNGGSYHLFKGLINHPSIWGRALSQSEIQQYMNCPPTGDETGLIGYWNFEEGGGSTVSDLTSNGNNGTLNGASWSTDVPNQACSGNVGCTATDSVYVNLLQAEIAQEDTTICFGDSVTLSIENHAVGYSLEFDGQDDWIQASTINLTDEKFTIEGWIRVPSVTHVDQTNVIDNYLFGSGGSDRWGIYIGGTGTGSGFIQGEIVAPTFGIFNSPRIDDNTWHHFAFVRDQNGIVKGYIDGQYFAEGSCPINYNLNAGFPTRINGGYHCGGGTQCRFMAFNLSEIQVSLRDKYSGNFSPQCTFDTETSSLLHYKFFSNSLNLVNDLSSNNNNGTIYGATSVNDFPETCDPGNILWSTGDTTASINVSPSQTTTYSVTVSNGISSCTDSVAVSVSSPSVDLGADTISLCDTATTLDAGPGYGSYLWSTGETSQTIDVDSSGMYSVTVGDSTGVANNHSLTFDGAGNQYINVPESASINSINDKLTIMAWVKTLGDLNGENPRIIDRSEGNGGGTDRWFLTHTSSNILQFGVGQGATQTVTGSSPLTIGEWIAVAAVYDAGSVTLYVNGTPEASGIISISDLSHVENVALSIGSVNGDNSFWNGLLDDIHIWNTALSQSEIQQYMNCPPTGSEAGLVGYWDFEEGTGSVVNDLSGNGNNGTINGASWSTDVPNQTCIGCTATDSVYVELTELNFDLGADTVSFCDTITTLDAGPGYGSYLWLTGETSQTIDVDSSGMYSVIVSDTSYTNLFSLGFDGQGEYVDLGSGVSFSDNFTIESWVKIPTTSLGLGYTPVIYAQSDSISGSQTPQGHMISLYGGKLEFFYRTTNNGSPNALRSNSVIQDNQWHHVAVSRVNGTVYMYIDGLLENQTSNYTNITFPPGTKSFLGRWWNGSAPSNGYDSTYFLIGHKSRLSIWDIGLSQSEIQQYMNCPPTGSESGLVGHWDFEEGTGSVVNDLSGNGNNGTINGASWSTDVPNQTCIGCTATDSVYVELTELNFDLGADTVSFCDTITTLDAGPGYGSYLWSTGKTTQTIDVDSSGMYSVTVGDATGVANNHSLGFNGNGDILQVPTSTELNSNDLTISFWANLNSYAATNQAGYNHFVNKSGSSNNQFVFANNNTGLYAYINNDFYLSGFLPALNTWQYLTFTFSSSTLEGKIYVNDSLVFSFVSNSSIAPTTYDLFIGGYGASSELYNTVDGEMDNVQIWNRALTQSEIQQYMTCPPSGNEAGLVGYWDFEEGTGSVVNDLSGNGNNGTVNGASWSTDVPNQTCIGCTATDSVYVELTELNVDLGADTISLCDTITTLDAGPGYGSYLWSTGETTQTIDVDSSGMYSVTVGDSSGVANNHSLSFDGVDDYVHSSHTLLPSTEFSINFFLKTSMQYGQIFYNGQSASGTFGQYGFLIDISVDGYLYTNMSSNSGYEENCLGSTIINDNVWHNICITYQNGVLKHYIDEVLDTQIITNGSSLVINNANESRIGVGVFNARYFDGLIDEFQIWNRALTQSEIQQYMTCSPTGSEAGLIGYWDFEEGSGGIVNDLSGNGNNGTLNGASWSTDVPNQTCGGCTASDSVYVDLFQAEIEQEDTTICFGDSVTLNAGGLGSSNSTSPRCDLPSNLQNGLVGYWPFCGNANDESGNGNDGTVNGATLTSDRFGNANSAYDFDGVNDYIEIADATTLKFEQNNSISIAYWFKILNLTSSGMTMVQKQDGIGSSQNGFNTGIAAGGAQYIVSNIAETNSPMASSAPTNSAYNDDFWHHAVITFTSGTTNIYVDDTLISISTRANSIVGDNSQSLYIGTGLPNNTAWTNGNLDDIGVWNRALSQQEVTQLYNNGTLTYVWSTGDTTASIDVSPTQTTTYSVAVSNGISSCTDSVTVTVSNQPPIITCLPDISTTSSTDGTGDCSTTVVIGNPGVSDDCDVPVLTAEVNGSVVDVNTYAFPVGTTTITWIATDGQGLADTCFQDIHVLDDEDPVLISCPLGIQVDNDPGDCGAIVTFVEPVFSDNCSFQVNSPALGSGSFFPIGLTNLTYTAIDPAGNQESCTVAVIVDDVERPVFLECPGDTTISTDALSCSASFSFPSAIVSDNCPNTSLQQLGLPSGANFPLGSSVVTFIVNDTSGNRDTCSFSVTVVDSVAPYFTSCPSDINIELGTQSCDTVVSWSSLSAFDNCSATITQINGLPSGSVFPVGSTLNRFVVTDNAGNTDTCSFTVTVTDNKPPVIVCPPPTIVNNVGSNCGPQVINYSLPTSTDNCVTVTTTRIAGPASGSVFAVGTTTVTYVATDNVGNSDTCSFTVTINDPLPPPASVDTISGPIEMCRNTSSFYSVNLASNATDYLWTVIGGDINPLAVGTNSRNKQITWQTSGMGMIIVEAVNTCYGSTPDTLEVMVYDNPSPVDAGLDSTTLCSPLSSFTLQATPPVIGTGVWSVVLGGGTIGSPNSPTSLVTGLSADSNLFRWTVTNAICTRTDSIYVIPDIEAPTATCQDITRFLPPAGFINVGLSEVVLSTADNCAVDSVWLLQSVFTCVDLGTATAEVIVSDSFGNLGGCTANVTLIDTIKPTAICQDITVVLNSLGEYTLNAQEVNGGSFDNCSLDSVYIDRSFFTCADTGIHQVMLTVVDLSGYRDSCMANVTVLDTAGPAINGCVDRTVFLDSSGVVVVDPNTLFLSIPNDPCGLASITTNVNQNIFTCEDAGPNTVVVTATDNNGNQSTCSSTVTVVDNIAPLAVCSDINVTLDSSGSYTILDANVFDAGSYDACGITTWIASPTTFTCSDTGSNIVTVTIYDSLGNTSTCTPSVNVSSNFSSTLDTTVCGGIVWNGSYYDSPGTYTYNTSSVTGCDSVALLNLTLYPAFTVSDSARGCDRVVVNGNVYFSSQVVVDSFVTADGCDSVVTTDVIIDSTRYGVDVKAICNSYTWVDGQTYTASTNTPTFTYTAANGCDSIVTLNLTILNSTSDSVSATACDSFTWNGTTYYQSGGYTYQTQNAVGCDSTATLLLTINSPTSSTTSISACNDYTWNGVTYQQSGTYTYQTQNANGCDSTATLVLTINSPTSSQESVTACDSYQWNGVTYQQGGTYTYQTQNANGCDSTATLVLTINSSTSSQESITVCDSYPWNGVTYQQSGTYTYQTQNAVGCDSTATLVLTINNSTSSQESITACDSYSWNGVTYQQSGTYTYQTQNANGCDSTATLILTINLSNSGVEVASACESYTWIDGNTYLSDTFGPTFTLSNASGCDSVVTLDLTIRNASSSIDTVTYCGVYTWADSVQYSIDTFGPTVTYINSVGCDSVVTLFLTIEPLNTVISVTQAFTLSAQQDNGTYQWIDCNNHNAPIPGETNQSYSPVETGLYAVIITANGCTDTSACVSQQGSGVGILESTLPSEVYLYPNPFADELHLELGHYYGSIRLVMYDMIGQTIYSQQYNGVDRIDPTMDVAAGTYTLRLEDDEGRYAMFRIVRKR